MNIVNLFNTEGYEHTKNPRVRYQSSFKEISENFGAKQLGFHTKILAPKSFSAPYHWHEGEEELIIVLEGEATIRCDGEFRKVKAGDLVYYPTGPHSVHHTYNHTDLPFKYFVLSNANVPDKCHYPDSKKESSPNGYLQSGVAVDYFKDEEDPSIYWPKDKL